METSCNSGKDEWWKGIWKLHVPNKFCLFLWRACSDILPCYAAFVKNNIVEEERCLLCGKESEIVMHALWHYV